ncbi:MAG: peptidyl-prolyl cis-trans isomerase [Candidatus Reddybacter sp.]
MDKSKLPALLYEPLLHFLVLGAALFIVFGLLNDADTASDKRIVITQVDLDGLAARWLKSRDRPPSAEEQEQQLEYFIRQQVLAREAVALGLDKDDAVVRNRLAKKMQYLFNDLSFIPEPSDGELNAYLNQHAVNFTEPAGISFQQIFFDSKLRNHIAIKDAAHLINQLRATQGVIDTINFGDRSLLPSEFKGGRESQVAGIFGSVFAKKVFLLPVNSWQGPVESEYGAHLVYILARTDARLPPLNKIRERVTREWQRTKQHAANEAFYQSLYQAYEIVVDATVATE